MSKIEIEKKNVEAAYKVADENGKKLLDALFGKAAKANALLGFRLCQETEEKARYFGTQFVELWAEYLAFNFTTGERIK